MYHENVSLWSFIYIMEMNNFWATPVSKKNLSRVVTDTITEALINGQLKPGDFLPSEAQLSKNMNVGKSSIREATKMLEAVGVVEIIKGHGCRIRTAIDTNALNPLTYQLILQNNSSHEKLVEFRQIIESAASCLAVEMITDAEILKLQALHNQMVQNIKNGIDNLDLDIEFHKIIYSCTKNPYFANIGSAIMILFKPSMTISNKKYSDIVIKNHAQILEAFKHHSVEDMDNAIKNSIRNWHFFSLSKEQ